MCSLVTNLVFQQKMSIENQDKFFEVATSVAPSIDPIVDLESAHDDIQWLIDVYYS